MKKILFIMLITSFTVPAPAKIFVYNWKCSDAGYRQFAQNIWRVTTNSRGYLVIDKQDASATAFFIQFYSRSSEGQTLKEILRWNANINVVTSETDNGTIMILFAGNPASRIFFMGEVKNDVVTKFGGSEVWNENYGNGYIGQGTARWSLNINKNWTAAAEGEGFNATATVNFIIAELIKRGYQQP